LFYSKPSHHIEGFLLTKLGIFSAELFLIALKEVILVAKKLGREVSGYK